jgi:hypothetical protein
MTGVERVRAIADFGFTERQARFLVLVMRHAGVCVPRQYASVAGIANGGKKSNEFFDKLVRRGYAAASDCLHNRARLYHVHHKALYRAIGEASSRYRRPVPARLATERVMLLDAVLTMPNLEWLTTVCEKRTYLASLTSAAADPAPDGPPEPASGKDLELPGAFPIGVHGEGRTALLYLATEAGTESFRRFLQAHVPLLRAAPAWTLRLVFPRPLDRWYDDYQAVLREELESPLHAATIGELKRFFEQRRRPGHASVHPETEAFPEIATRGFTTTRFALLYRRWLRHGDVVFDLVSSPAIADALNEGRGTVDSVVLPHLYGHLSPLVAGDLEARAGVEKGARRGAATSGRPQPPTSHRSPISSTSALL